MSEEIFNCTDVIIEVVDDLNISDIALTKRKEIAVLQLAGVELQKYYNSADKLQYIRYNTEESEKCYIYIDADATDISGVFSRIIVDTLDLSKVLSKLEHLKIIVNAFAEIECKVLNVSNMPNIKYAFRAFYYSDIETIIGLEDWPIKNTDIELNRMFEGSRIHSDLDFDKWDLSNCTMMQYMFADAQLQGVKLNAEIDYCDITGLFLGATVETLDMYNFNVKRLIGVSHAFSELTTKKLVLKEFDMYAAEHIESAEAIFNGCFIEHLVLSKFRLSDYNNKSCFSDCKIKTLTAPHMFSEINNTSQVFIALNIDTRINNLEVLSNEITQEIVDCIGNCVTKRPVISLIDKRPVLSENIKQSKDTKQPVQFTNSTEQHVLDSMYHPKPPCSTV